MAWLKLTDELWSNRKTQRLLKRGRNGSGLTAFGLHMAGLLHCAKYLTDGYVEPDFVEETLDDAKVSGKRRAELVDALVRGGQWNVKGDGWLIHDYLDHNPSREEVLERRARDAARKARGREAQSADDPQDVRADAAGTDAGTNLESDGPVPSRPVPTHTRDDETHASAQKQHPLFDQVMGRLEAVADLLPVEGDDMGVLAEIRAAQDGGEDVLELVDATVAAIRDYHRRGTLTARAPSGVMRGLRTRRAQTRDLQLAVESTRARVAYERPAKLNHASEAERLAAEAEAEADRLEREQERGRAA